MTGKKIQKKPSLASADGGFFVRVNTAYCAISTKNPNKNACFARRKKVEKKLADPLDTTATLRYYSGVFRNKSRKAEREKRS